MKPKIVDRGRNNSVEVSPNLNGKSLQIEVSGSHNHVTIGPNAYARGTAIGIAGDGNVVHVDERVTLPGRRLGRFAWRISGNANTLLIGKHCSLAPRIDFEGDGGTVDIGAGTTCFSGMINVREGSTISIGADCMFASGWWIADSDMHTIYDRSTGNRLNPGADIIIEEHVWLTQGVLIMKGSHIGKGAVIGANALVSGVIPAHSLAYGTPARVVRKDIHWERKLPGMNQSISATTQASITLSGFKQSNR